MFETPGELRRVKSYSYKWTLWHFLICFYSSKPHVRAPALSATALRRSRPRGLWWAALGTAARRQPHGTQPCRR